jgi:hypothetical protein
LPHLSDHPLKYGWKLPWPCNTYILHTGKNTSCGQSRGLLSPWAVARPSWTMESKVSVPMWLNWKIIP